MRSEHFHTQCRCTHRAGAHPGQTGATWGMETRKAGLTDPFLDPHSDSCAWWPPPRRGSGMTFSPAPALWRLREGPLLFPETVSPQHLLASSQKSCPGSTSETRPRSPRATKQFPSFLRQVSAGATVLGSLLGAGARQIPSVITVHSLPLPPSTAVQLLAWCGKAHYAEK